MISPMLENIIASDHHSTLVLNPAQRPKTSKTLVRHRFNRDALDHVPKPPMSWSESDTHWIIGMNVAGHFKVNLQT